MLLLSNFVIMMNICKVVFEMFKSINCTVFMSCYKYIVVVSGVNNMIGYMINNIGVFGVRHVEFSERR